MKPRAMALGITGVDLRVHAETGSPKAIRQNYGRGGSGFSTFLDQVEGELLGLLVAVAASGT